MGGAVSTGHPATAEAAAVILREGGNAFDAVLAGMAAACVCEPVLCSLGGGGFLMAKPADGEPRVLDFFAQTPLRRPDPQGRDFSPVLCDFGTVQQEFHIGMASMATPGLVRGLFEVNQTLGRMPLGRTVEPAIKLAKEGVPLHELQAYIFQVVGPIYMQTDGSRAIFESKINPGELVGEGESVSNPDLAGFFDALVREGDGLFYRGEIAARVAEDCLARGGSLSRADFEAFRLERRRPLVIDYGGARIFTNPPPSTGGLLIAFALEILSGAREGFGGLGSPAHLTTLVQAMALTNEARIESRMHEAAPDEAAANLLNPAMLDTYRQRIAGHPKAHRGTTHISVVDAAGNAASLTVSNGEGCGYVAPETGVMMNNMLGEEDINPYGFHNWPLNARMSSMMSPSVIVDADGRVTALGSGGSNRIRTAILQVLMNILDFRLPLGDAVEYARVHFERGLLNIEPGFPQAGADALVEAHKNVKLWEAPNLFFGGVHAAQADIQRGSFDGAGDPRRGGASIVLT